MRSPEGFSEDSDHTIEAKLHPEVKEVLEFLATYKKIQEIMSWLVEASVNTDGVVKAVRRGHMQKLMLQLGLDPEHPGAFAQLDDLKAGLTDRIVNPRPQITVPEVGFFKSRIERLITEQERYGDPSVGDYVVEGEADLVGLAQYGHTNWSDVQSRTSGMHIGEWAHGIARIMGDPVAYHAEFAGLGIDAGHRAADHLEIANDWSIRNGRHRSLVARSLGEDYVRETGMAQWVPVALTEDWVH